MKAKEEDDVIYFACMEVVRTETKPLGPVIQPDEDAVLNTQNCMFDNGFTSRFTPILISC